MKAKLSVLGWVVASLSAALVSGCVAKTAATATGDAAAGGGNGGSPAGPTYGMNCTGTFGADNVGTYPVSYVSAINGSTVTAIQYNMYLQGAANSNIVGTINLDVYTCGAAGSLGSNITTVSLTNTTLNGFAAAKTFTFGAPITVPTNCAAGEAPLVFKFSTTGFGGGNVFANEVLTSTSCFLHRSTSATGTAASPHAYTAVITATP